MGNHTEMTTENLKNYRDDVIYCLKRQIKLLQELKEKGFATAVAEIAEGEKGAAIFTDESIKDSIAQLEGEIKKLEHFDVVLSVVGTMKAGKSTTINAIVGQEIMPNRNRPMTALPTLVIHQPECNEPRLTFNNPAVVQYINVIRSFLEKCPHIKNDQQLLAYQKLITKIEDGYVLSEHADGKDEIYMFLEDLNDLIRISEIMGCLCSRYSISREFNFPYEACREIEQLPAIEVAFSHLSNMPQTEGRLILLDTPGPNEAGQEKLRGMLSEQLRRSSAVLLVLDYTQLKSEAGQSVREQIEKIPAIDSSKLFALVNKFDNRNNNSDDSEMTKDIIYQDFLQGKIEREHIYPISAQRTYLANRMLVEISRTNTKPVFSGWVCDFAEEAYGAIEEDEWAKKDDIADIANKCNVLIKKGKMKEPIDQAIIQTQHTAPQLAISSALAHIRPVLDDMNDQAEIICGVGEYSTHEELEKIKENIKALSGHIDELEALHAHVGEQFNECRDRAKQQLSSQVNNLKEEIRCAISNMMSDAQKKTEESICLTEESIRLRQERKRGGGLFSGLFNVLSSFVTEINSGNEYNQMCEYLNKHSNGDSIVVSSDSESAALKLKIQGYYEEVCKKFCGRVEDELNEAIAKINDFVQNTEEKCQKISKEICKKFQEINIDLSPQLVELSRVDGFGSMSYAYNRSMQRQTETRRYEKSGVWNSIKRFCGFESGYGSYTNTYYCDSISGIIKHLITSFDNEVVAQVQRKIESTFGEENAHQIEGYVDSVRHKAAKVTNELKTTMDKFGTDEKTQQERLKNMQSLSRRRKELEDDLQHIAEKFGLEWREDDKR